MIGYRPPKPTGSSPEALFMQAVWEKLWGESSRIMDATGSQVSRTTRGNVIVPKPGKWGGISAKRYRVKSVQGDYLTCRTWDGSTEGDADVLVAKPPQLRHSITAQTIDGVSVTYASYTISSGVCERVASAAGEDDQDEMVIPVWQIAGTGADAEIWADQPSGGTGVDDAPVWQDTNRDARAWCQLYPEAA
jgi:hypothetical protein